MKHKILYILLGFSLGLNVSLCGAMAYWWTHPGTGLVAPAWKRAFAHLPSSLRNKLQEARRPYIPEFRKIRNELCEARGELLTALRDDPLDNAKMNQRMDKIADLERGMQNLIVDRIRKESGILSPEEKKMYFEPLEKRLCPFRKIRPWPRVTESQGGKDLEGKSP